METPRSKGPLVACHGPVGRSINRGRHPRTLPPALVSQTKTGLSMRIREAGQAATSSDERDDMLSLVADA